MELLQLVFYRLRCSSCCLSNSIISIEGNSKNWQQKVKKWQKKLQRKVIMSEMKVTEVQPYA